MDPFAVLGLEPDLELGAAQLDKLHLQLSRECHPDYHRDADADRQIAVLQRAAEINDAYRMLRDRWRRAEALLELRDPGVLERTKKLSPEFLMTAMELSEEVAEAGDAERPALAARLQAEIDAHWQRVRALCDARDWHGAAVALHESRYHRKARQDLEA